MARAMHFARAMLLLSLTRAWRDAPVQRIAFVLGVAGLCAIAIGFVTHAHPYAATLGYDSAMTVGVFAFVLALLHGIGYRRSLEVLSPIFVVQIVGALRHGVSSAPLGTELVIFSIVGFALLALRGGAEAPRRGLT